MLIWDLMCIPIIREKFSQKMQTELCNYLFNLQLCSNMKTIGTALRDIVSGLDVFEQDQAKKDLLDLKKQIAQEVVEKFQKQNADFIVSLSNELIVDYLVDE